MKLFLLYEARELSQRQHEIVNGIRDGKTVSEIASDIGVSRQRAYQIVKALFDRGIITDDEMSALSQTTKSRTKEHMRDVTKRKFDELRKDPEAFAVRSKKISDRLKEVWKERGGFWEYMLSLPQEKAVGMIKGLVTSYYTDESDRISVMRSMLNKLSEKRAESLGS